MVCVVGEEAGVTSIRRQGEGQRVGREGRRTRKRRWEEDKTRGDGGKEKKEEMGGRQERGDEMKRWDEKSEGETKQTR